MIKNLSMKNLFYFNGRKKNTCESENKFNDISYDDRLPEKNLTVSNIKQNNIRINDSNIYYFKDAGQENINKKKNVTVDEILPLYIYENKLKLEGIYFSTDANVYNEKISDKNTINEENHQNMKNSINDSDTNKDKSKITILFFIL